MAKHNDLGNEGEEVARQYLMDKGYQILETNWRFKKKEIDVIALVDEVLVIVETKTRSTEEWEHPADAVTNSKIRFLVDATEAYIFEKDIDREVRFDIVSVIAEGQKWKIDHIEDAFYAPVN